MNNGSNKLLKVGGYATLLSLFAVAIVVVVNLIVNTLPATFTKLDTSAAGIFTFDEQTENLLKAVKEDVNLYYLVQAGGEDTYVSGILERYAALSSHVKVVSVDPALHPSFLKHYTEESLNENSVIVESEKRFRIVNYTEMYDVEYGIDYSTYQYTQNVKGFCGEKMLTSAIDYVTTDVLPTVYLLEGHGETEFSETFLGYIDEENFACQKIGLIGKEEMPSDCDCLIINAPQKDITSEEKTLIETYLAGGGHMMVLSAYNAETPNLDAILAFYGAARKNGLVCDTGTGRYYQYPYWLLPNIATSHAITSPLSGYTVFAPYSDGIVESGTTRDGLTYTALLYTSFDAYVKKNVGENTSLVKEGNDEAGTFNAAVALEENQTRIVWIVNDQMMTDNADYTCAGANSAFFINSLGWMCEKESSISVPSKDLSENALVVSSSASTVWALILIFAIPAAFIAAGTVIYIKRRRA